IEHLEGFRFVFDQRIALPIAAQADAVTQAVHLVKMLLPQLVNRRQDREALDFLERIGILEADFDFVGVADFVRNEIAHAKLCCSTRFWACPMERLSKGCSSSWPSSRPIFSMYLTIRSEPNSRIKSSSSEMKKCEEPGSPWRAQRPRNWRSMRRASWRSVPI